MKEEVADLSGDHRCCAGLVSLGVRVRGSASDEDGRECEGFGIVLDGAHAVGYAVELEC